MFIKKIKWDIVLFAVAGIFFLMTLYTYYENRELKQSAENVRLRVEKLFDGQTNIKAQDNEEYTSPYKELFDANKDMIAWISIPETNIDYPVMHTPSDEQFYLHRNFFGEEDKNGTLFLDRRCNINDNEDNLIIHGHHMKSGAMFGSLPKFLNEEYKNKHSQIYLYTRDEERVYEIIACFTSKLYRQDSEGFKYYEYIDLNSAEQLEAFNEGIKQLNKYSTTPDFKQGDEFITLSTCSYHTKNGRLAVVARIKNKKFK
ncbi:MAG: class B sortase [Lachnospiraceae bacterium]|nr:class B sortase [Lachnospiraceae bacterium]